MVVFSWHSRRPRAARVAFVRLLTTRKPSMTLLHRSPFAVLTLIALAVNAPQRGGCGAATRAPQTAPYQLSYDLELDHRAAGKRVAGLPDKLTFRAASGHELTHVVQQGAASRGVVVRGWDPLHLSGAPIGNTMAVDDWHSQVRALAQCPGGSTCDLNAEWRKSGLPLALDGTLTARMDDGQWLYRYTFFEAWPSAVSTVPGQIVALSLVTGIGGLHFNPDHPFFQELKSKYEISGNSQSGLTVRHARSGADLPIFRAKAAGIDTVEAALDHAYNRTDLEFHRVSRHHGDSLPTHGVKIEIGGVIAGGFKEITGLASELEVIEFKDAADPITHKRPGKARYKNIVLKRGLVSDASLLEFYKNVLAGSTDRKSGSIIYLDREGSEVARYNLFEAWPCRWKAPELNAFSDTPLVEELELAVGRVERR